MDRIVASRAADERSVYELALIPLSSVERRPCLELFAAV